MTKRAGRSAANDPGLQPCSAPADAACFVAKSWDYHVRVALGCTNEENLEKICAESVEGRVVAAGKEVLVDCEHFFDGYKANPDYALACAKRPMTTGARWVVLCDTNGGTQPSEVRDIIVGVRSLKACPATISASTPMTTPGRRSPTSLAAVEAGVRQIQGTLNGIGERCGNANLVTLIPTLVLKPAFAEKASRPASPRNS
jgi:2-isopropylmalate synthase